MCIKWPAMRNYKQISICRTTTKSSKMEHIKLWDSIHLFIYLLTCSVTQNAHAVLTERDKMTSCSCRVVRKVLSQQWINVSINFVNWKLLFNVFFINKIAILYIQVSKNNLQSCKCVWQHSFLAHSVQKYKTN